MKQLRASDLGIDIPRVEQNLKEFRSLPIHTYFDPSVYEFELGAIFDDNWQYFGPLNKLSEPGSVVAGQIGRTPVAVARADDGKLYGFVNICRHRGYSVVEGEKKNCRLLVCRYHAWSYKLNGALARAPNTENEPGFEAEEFGLLPVSVDTWGPAVFVNPLPDAPCLRDVHPELTAFTEAFDLITDPDHYSLYREVVTEQNSNWKLWYDNGVECYHCPTIHGESFGAAYNVQEGEYDYRLEGRMTSYRFRTGERNAGENSLTVTRYGSFQIFPGCQMIQQNDIMILAQMVPTGPTSCRFIAHYYSEKGADLERVDRWIELWMQTYDEDARATELQQVNLQSGRAKEFRYVSGREEPAIFINSLIWDAYKQHLIDDTPAGYGRAAE